MTVTPLHTDMDALKVGPGGQTLGELKQAVLDAEAALVAALNEGATTQDHIDACKTSQRMLRAAYVRMGLPPKTP